MILKWMLKEYDIVAWIGWRQLKSFSSNFFCENGNDSYYKRYKFCFMSNSLLRRIYFVEFPDLHIYWERSWFLEIILLFSLTYSQHIRQMQYLNWFISKIYNIVNQKIRIRSEQKICLNLQKRLAVLHFCSPSIAVQPVTLFTLYKRMVWEVTFEQYWRVVIIRRLIILEATMWPVTSDTISYTSMMKVLLF